MTQWYYAQNGQQKGPVTFEELHNLAGTGALAQGDLVWNTSMKDWVPAASIDGLFARGLRVEGGPPADPSNPYATPASVQYPGTMPLQEAPLEEIEPGSETIEVMTCIQRGFELTKRQFLVLFLGLLIIVGISIAVSMPFSIAQAFTQGANPQQHTLPPEVANNPAAAFQWGMKQQFTAIYFIQQLVSLVVSSFLFAGYNRICLNVASNVVATPGQLFGQGAKTARILGISILLSIPQWIGYAAVATAGLEVGGTVFLAMLLVGLVMWLRLGFAALAVVDRDLSLVDALKYSLSITRNNSFRLLGLYILAGLIMLLGALACFVGMFFTVPMAFMALTVAYRWARFGRRSLLDRPVA